MASRDDLLNQPRSGARPLGGSPGSSTRPIPRARQSRPEPAAAAPRPAARPKATRVAAKAAAPERAVVGRRRGEATRKRAERGYRAAGRGAKAVTRRGPVGAKHVLTAELIIGMIIVLVRVVADYEPQSDGTVKGKVGHPKGQYGPLPITAGLITTFFFLSFFVAKGGRWASTANAFGALIIVVLGMKSIDEVKTVTKTFPGWGTGVVPAGKWDTEGTPAGEPVQGSLVPGEGGGVAPSNPQGPAPKPHSGRCPPGWTDVGGRCYPNVQGGTVPF